MEIAKLLDKWNKDTDSLNEKLSGDFFDGQPILKQITLIEWETKTLMIIQLESAYEIDRKGKLI